MPSARTVPDGSGAVCVGPRAPVMVPFAGPRNCMAVSWRVVVESHRGPGSCLSHGGRLSATIADQLGCVFTADAQFHFRLAAIRGLKASVGSGVPLAAMSGTPMTSTGLVEPDRTRPLRT